MRRIVADAAGRSRIADRAVGETEYKRPLGRKKKRTIAVVGISRGAGTTFVATSLAFLLSKFVEKSRNNGETPLPACVSYVEMRRPRSGESQVYFSAGLDRRFGQGRFIDFFQLYKEGRPLNRNVNLHKGINWVVWRRSGEQGEAAGIQPEVHAGTAAGIRPEVAPGTAAGIRPEAYAGIWPEAASGIASGTAAGAGSGTGLEPAAAVRSGAASVAGFPIGQLAGDYVVADSPDIETLRQYDLVVAVIDPMPGCVFAGAANYEKLQDLKMSGLPVIWVVNRDNDAVNHGELRRFLRLKDDLTIPLLEGRLFYESQYTCRLPVELILKEERDSGEGSVALQKLAEAVFL